MRHQLRKAAVISTLVSICALSWCGCGKHAEIGIVFGAHDQSNGLKRIENRDGNTTLTNAFGSACRRLEDRSETYLYLQAAPKFKTKKPMQLTVTVECLAAKPGTGLASIWWTSVG